MEVRLQNKSKAHFRLLLKNVNLKLKGDDIANYINVKHSCQEFSLFQIERLGDHFSAGPIREAARAVDQ